MRGNEERQTGFFVMTTLEDVVPADHPLRAIRTMVDTALSEMSLAPNALCGQKWPGEIGQSDRMILLRGSRPRTGLAPFQQMG